MIKKMYELMLILFFSLLGSWHCAGMCGTFCLIACDGNNKNKFNFYYHAGRLTTYLSLTTLAFMSFIPIKSILENSSLFIIATVFVFIVVSFWFLSQWIPYVKFLNPFTKKISLIKNFKTKAFLIGLSTTLLPCGWLYTFIGYAALKDNFYLAYLTIIIFWLGTLPAFFALEYFKVNKLLMSKFRNITVVCLFLLALFQINYKINSLNNSVDHKNSFFCQPLGSKTQK